MKKDDFNYILELVKKYVGWDLGEEKFFIMDRKIYNFVREKGYANVEDLIAEIHLGHKPLLWQVIEALALSDTSFYRDYPVFKSFENNILPHVKEANRGSKKLRIWSLGCASGQETYSIAISVKNKLKTNKDWDIKILGTDISTSSISKAQKGIYSQFEVQMGLNARMILDNFHREGSNWHINQDIMNLVDFRRYNMMDNIASAETYDIIFCRNVLRFFTKEAQSLIINHIYHHQVPGGFLYLGLGEQAQDLDKYYEPIKGFKCLYQAKINIDSHPISQEEINPSKTSNNNMPSFVRPDNLRPLASDILKK